MCSLVVEIENCRRIDCITHKTGLEMQVWTGASAGAAAQTYGLTCPYHLVRFHKYLVKMAINGLKLVGMAKYYVIAVASCLVIRKPYLAVESRIDCIVRLYGKVGSLVHSSEAGTIAIV